MIKNENQLQNSLRRVKELEFSLKAASETYSSIQKEIVLTPILEEINELYAEIEEYMDLRSKSLSELVAGRLQNPIPLENIGELLAKLRIAAGITQSEMAKKLGWHQSNLSRFESENYSSQTIAKISEYISELDVWLYVTPSLDDMIAQGETAYINSVLTDLPRQFFEQIPSDGWISTSGILTESENRTLAQSTKPTGRVKRLSDYIDFLPDETENYSENTTISAL